jgi:acyl-coenzyme A thioesterase PaaI-like protein
MANQVNALALWRTLSTKPGGKWLFSKLVCFQAPYFSTIRPRFVDLESGRCVLTIPKRRAVQNHIGTVHAIAMCNMAELAGGTMTEVSIPTTHRWIPKGMKVEYIKKAETNLRAEAAFTTPVDFGPAAAVPVTVNVTDTKGQLVFRAEISMWISPK